MYMSDKLYVKTRSPIDRNVIVEGEQLNVIKKVEPDIIYELENGVVVRIKFELDSINIPIDPKTGTYFTDEYGEPRYNIDYHIRVNIAKRKQG